MNKKKIKTAKKLLKQLSRRQGFRSPYQIVVEEGFLKEFNSRKLGVKLFEVVLADKPKLLISECSYRKYKEMNLSFKNDLSRHLEIRRCRHPKGTGVMDCLRDLVKNNNKNHYFIACNDKEIIGEIGGMGNVPILRLKQSALVLEKMNLPSGESENTLEKGIEKDELDRLKGLFPNVPLESNE
jgi:U3 small nucleolar RNA-associated protein 23